MEPIAFIGAPLRRWPVIVTFLLVGIIVALLIPTGSSSPYPADTWQANAEVGLTPPYPSNHLGAKLGLRQLEFYAHAPVVIATAARTAGVAYTKALKNDVLVTKSKTHGQPNVLDVAVLQPTKGEAVNLTNALVAALAAYSQVQLEDQYKNDIYVNGVYIQNLQSAIAALPLHGTTSISTPTTVPVKVKKTKIPTTPTTHAPTTTTTTHPATTTTAHSLASPRASASLAAFTSPNDDVAPTSASLPGRSVLVDTTSSTVTTISTATSPGAVTTTTISPEPTGSTSVGSSSTTNTSVPKGSLLIEERVLANELGNAVAAQQRLKAQGTPATGYRIVAPAARSSAIKLNPNPSLLSNDFVRALLGLLIGLILGVVATWLLDGFDRRIRTTKRAEELFGLPVVTEIQSAGSKSLSVIPVVDVIVDPYSTISEAYRELHVAILSAPPVTWVRRGGVGDYLLQPPLPQPRGLVMSPPEPEPVTVTGPGVVGVAAQGPTGSAADETPTGQMHLPVAVKSTELVVPRRSRFSILIASPNDEPTRSLVVVNLAALFAEAGDRVLVATTGGLRTDFEGNGRGTVGWEPEGDDTSSAELLANARPSQIPGVSSLALGQIFSNPSRFAVKADSLVRAARDVVDVLLLEAPLLATQDGAALLPFVDLVVIVCEAWHTTVSDGVRTKRLLTQRRPPVLGLVMTNMPPDHAKILNA